MLGELIKGSILTQNHVLVVVDGCLYDAETAKACLEQNCKQGNSQPRAIFLGLSWIQEKDLIRQGVACRRVIAENVSQAVADALKEKLRKKAYLMPSSVAIPEVSGAGVSGVSHHKKGAPKVYP